MHRSHENKFISWWRTMVYGLIYLSQGILILCTLGWITPHWDIDYVFYTSKKDLKKRIDEE